MWRIASTSCVKLAQSMEVGNDELACQDLVGGGGVGEEGPRQSQSAVLLLAATGGIVATPKAALQGKLEV